MSAVDEVSLGHIAWIRNYEYFERDNHVYSAHKTNAVMPDGYRTGKWECTKVRWSEYSRLLGFVKGVEK